MATESGFDVNKPHKFFRDDPDDPDRCELHDESGEGCHLPEDNPIHHVLGLDLDPTLAGPALRSEQGDGDEPVNADGLTEAEIIDLADLEIRAAQYRALHARLEDFTIWLIEMGFMGKNAVVHPDAPPDDTSYRFDVIETYLNEATEHEDRSPLAQILQPDMDEPEAGRPMIRFLDEGDPTGPSEATEGFDPAFSPVANLDRTSSRE